MNFTIDASELNDLARDLAKAGDDHVNADARKVTQGVARRVKQAAQAAAPRDRPWLATQGIHQKTWADSSGVHVDVFTGIDARGVNVGLHVEYGTSDTAPQPFLTPQTLWAGPELVRQLTAIVDPFKPSQVVGE